MYQNVVSMLARNGIIAAVTLFVVSIHAASGATLAWNASPSPNVTGYTVRYGTVSGSYPFAFNAGNALTAAISTLTAGTKYYFVVTARNSSGMESDPSNEISHTPSGSVLPNVLPTLDPISNFTINEDASQQSVALTGITAGLGDLLQVLSVTASSSNPALIPSPTVTYTSPNATGTLRFTPAPNATGTATITVTVNDSQLLNNLFSRSFTVTVNPVNDAPTLNALNSLALAVNAARQTVALSGISPGAANESQTLIVTATSSNPGLIPAPTVSYTSPSATGSISFTPVANATGTATVIVTVNDGQSLNNVVSRSFTVTVSSSTSTTQTMFVEAESGARTGSMVASSDANASASQYVYANSGSAGTVSFAFSAARAGDYWVWCRVLSPDTARDSFFVSMDGGADEIYTTAPNSWSSVWQWTKVNLSGATRTYTLNQGSHTLVFRNREASTSLDALYITSDPNFVPSGTGGVNTAPTLGAIGNLTINEDAAQQTISLSGIGSGSASESQTLVVAASSSNPALIPNPVVSYVTPNASGTLAFTPVANAYGTATITVTVNDGQAQNNLVSRTFTVTANPINDPPTLNAPVSLTLAVNAPRQTVALSGISSGAANESQTLAVTTTSSNPSLIPAPTVNYTSPSATGSISFTPAANLTGTATITVTVNDGQAQNGTMSRSFTVTVTGPTTQTIYVQAESGARVSPMTIGSDINAANGQYVYSPTANQGTLSVLFSVSQAGDYWVWCRVLSPDNGRDSLFFSIDGGTEEIFTTAPNSSWSSNWQWTQLNVIGALRTFTLNQGSHTLVFRCREASTLLDALYITNDRNFVPATAAASPTFTAASAMAPGEEEITSAAPAPTDATGPVVSGLEVVSSDTSTVTLAWHTDEPALSLVQYGVTTALSNSTPPETNYSAGHKLSLKNLQLETAYLVRIQSIDAAGNVSFTEIGTVRTPALNTFAWAAEDGTLAKPMKIDAGAGALDGNYISSAVNGHGSALFPLNVSVSSNYRLWCRVWVPSGRTGSFRVSLDGAEGVTFRAVGNSLQNGWRWIQAGDRTFDLDEGQHQFALQVIEAGMLLDEMILSNDPSWTPED